MADLTSYGVDLPFYEGADYCVCAAAEEPTAVPPEATHTATLVFDMKNPAILAPVDEADAFGQWYVHRRPGTAPVGACMDANVFHWLDEDGTDRYEDDQKFYDGTATQILTKLHFAPVSASDIQGAFRLFLAQARGVFYGAAAIRVTAVVADESYRTVETWTYDIDMTDESLEEFEFNPDPSRATSVEFTFEEVASGHLTEGWALRSVALEVGGRGRLRKLAAANKIGD